jgi:hypothetical protein
MEFVSVFLIKLTTGFPDCCVSAPSDDEPVLKINSKKGISMPIEIIEKMIERTVKKK